MAMLDVVRDFLVEDEWPVTESGAASLIRTGYRGTSGKWDVFIYVREPEEQVVCYSAYSTNTPAVRRIAMAELIARINSGIAIGNFEIDFDDGEARYKTSIDVEGTGLTQSLVSRLIYANVLMMNRYLPALMMLIYSNSSPVEVLVQIEESAEELAVRRRSYSE